MDFEKELATRMDKEIEKYTLGTTLADNESTLPVEIAKKMRRKLARMIKKDRGNLKDSMTSEQYTKVLELEK